MGKYLIRYYHVPLRGRLLLFHLRDAPEKELGTFGPFRDAPSPDSIKPDFGESEYGVRIYIDIYENRHLLIVVADS